MTDAPLSLGTLTEVLQARGLRVELRGLEDAVVSGVSQDSRVVRPGDLFLAWRGTDRDAHDYVSAAAAAGAAAAVVESFVPGLEIPQIEVSDGRLAGAVAADWVLGSPWQEFFTVGVTGTNGKTTTALLTRHLLGQTRSSVAVGTLGIVDSHGRVRPGTEGLTTPGPVQLSQWLRDFTDEGMGTVTLEASSHALDQRRMDGVRFDVAVFTNLGCDHLDYHKTMEDYFSSKARLLDLLKPGGVAVLNHDDVAWNDLPLTGVDHLTYGSGDECDVSGSNRSFQSTGSRFRLATAEGEAEVEIPLLGDFNVSNALAAAGVALTAGLSLGEIADGLRSAPQVPGRLEVVVSEPFSVLVDFAHTPDALENVLATVRPLVPGKLIVVFGAGGDRDRTKRPLMGKTVARFADEVVVTSDNPRTEDPGSIVDDILAGIDRPAHRVVDRRSAIAAALEIAQAGDLVLLAGKGHERYQVVGEERLPFDEREVVHAALSSTGGREDVA